MSLTKSMRTLITKYVGHATRSESLEDVDWGPLAHQLRISEETIAAAVASQSESEQEKIWQESVELRVEHLNAHSMFNQVNWQRVEGKAVDTIMRMLQSGLIRDPSELLSVAKIANQMNTSNPKQPGNGAQRGDGLNIRIGFDGPSSAEEGGDHMNHVPGKLEAVHIDLSPRVAQSLGQRREQSEQRVIDAERVDVESLRNLSHHGSLAGTDGES